MYNTSEFEKQVTSISSNIYVDILKTSDHHPINIEYVLTDEIYNNGSSLIQDENNLSACNNKNFIKIQPNLEHFET